MKNFLVLAVVLTTAMAYSQTQNLQADTQGTADFCRYTQEQGAAMRDFLRTPGAEIGPIQPSTGTPPQMVVGVTESVSSLWKAHLTMKVADTTCKLYAAA